MENARELFNLQGYLKITIRSISAEVGAGNGVITHHFPKKTHLLRALFKEQYNILMEEVQYLQRPMIPIPEFCEVMNNYRRVKWKYRFIWRDLPYLLRHDVQLGSMYNVYRVEKRIELERIIQTWMDQPEVANRECATQAEVLSMAELILQFEESCVSTYAVTMQYPFETARLMASRQFSFLLRPCMNDQERMTFQDWDFEEG